MLVRCRVWPAIALAALLPMIAASVARPSTPAELDPHALVTTVVGTGVEAVHPDHPAAEGTTATRAALGSPLAVATLRTGDLVALYGGDCRLWRADDSGAIHLFAGNGRCEHTGDGGRAVDAGLWNPTAIAVQPDGGVLVGEPAWEARGERAARGGARVRRIGLDGRIVTVAGSESGTPVGDGGPALEAGLAGVVALATLADGGYLIAGPDNTVRRVDPSGVIQRVAGAGTPGFGGDGGPALDARFRLQSTDREDGTNGLAALADGAFLVADTGNHRVRRVDADGRVRTVAGGGRRQPGARPIPATQAKLVAPRALLAETDGSYLLVDGGAVLRADPEGRIGVVANGYDERPPLEGPGTGIFNGDGRSPLDATFAASSLARADDGTLLVSDSGSARIRQIAKPGSGFPAIAVTRTRVGPSSIGVDFVTTRPGQVTLGTQRAKIATTTERLRGRASIAVPARAGVHALQLRLLRRGRVAAADSVGVVVGRLGLGVAARAIYTWDGVMNLAAGEIEECRRFGPLRVDCVRVWYDQDSVPSCYNVNAVTVASDGLARFREYDCPGGAGPVFRRYPRWSPALSTGRWIPFGTRGVIPGLIL